MFSSLLSWLKGAWDSTNKFWKDFFKVAWDFGRDYLTKAWTVGVAVMSFFVWAFGTIKDAVVDVWTSVSSLTMPNVDPHAPGSLGWVFNVANTLFPLAELCAFLVGYLTLRLALTLYRLIKSWIPTLS